jgi:pyrophosphatase PpaX
MIKAVIFDIDGVLLDSFEANLKFFQDLMIRAGYNPPTRKEYPNYFHLTMWNAITKLTGLTSEDEIKKIWEIGKNREIRYPVELLKIPEGAEAVIDFLSHDYKLAIVTSRVRNGVYESPELATMQKYFSVVLTCEDTTNHKPHPESLLLAAQKLGIKPEEAIYIGDVENDLKAARAAGMKIIIYSINALPDANACTSIFKDLPELVKKISS